MLKNIIELIFEKVKNRKLEDYYDPFSGTVMLVPKEKRHRMK